MRSRKQNNACEPPEEAGPVLRRENDCRLRMMIGG